MLTQEERVLNTWIKRTDRALTALRIWHAYLYEWRDQGHETVPGDLMSGLERLRGAGLDDWINDAQPGLNELVRAVLGGWPEEGDGPGKIT